LKVIDRVQILKTIEETKGRIFSANFIKRTNGEDRLIVCRVGVRKGVKDIGLNYSPADKGLVVVFDMFKRAFRMINLDTVYKMKINKEIIKINN